MTTLLCSIWLAPPLCLLKPPVVSTQLWSDLGRFDPYFQNFRPKLETFWTKFLKCWPHFRDFDQINGYFDHSTLLYLTCSSPLLLKTAGGLYSTLVWFGVFRVLDHLGLVYGHISNFWYSMDLYRIVHQMFTALDYLRNFQANNLRILALLIEFSHWVRQKVSKNDKFWIGSRSLGYFLACLWSFM